MKFSFIFTFFFKQQNKVLRGRVLIGDMDISTMNLKTVRDYLKFVPRKPIIFAGSGCRVLQGVAGCCRVLQCVAACCSVLQRDHVRMHRSGASVVTELYV